MALVELHRFYVGVDAEMARIRLAAAGIEAYIFDASTSYVHAATGIRLMVDEGDEEEARLILEESGEAPQPR